MFKSLSLLLIIFFALSCANTSQPPVFQNEQHPFVLESQSKQVADLNYLLYLPEFYTKSDKKWPLILFLHGSGERGNDVNKVKVHGPPKLVAQGQALPFIVVSPQLANNALWTNTNQLNALDNLLDYLVTHYQVDEKRIYLTGLSMGGYGTWSLAAKHSNRFAAIAPICGGGNPDSATLIAHIPTWVFHGAKDKAVKPEESSKMVDALKKVGGNVKFTLYPEAGHDSWTESYNNPKLYEWFLQHKLSEKSKN